MLATGPLTVVRTKLVGNAAAAGGGIASLGFVQIVDSNLEANSAADRGGAILAGCAVETFSITGGEVLGNRATSGGAVWLAGRTADLVGVRLAANNTTGPDGGAVVVSPDACSITALRVGADVSWIDNEPDDLVAGRGFAAPDQPFLCEVGPSSVRCPVPLP